MTALDTHRLAKERLAAKRALLEAGTPGPWDIDKGDIGAGDEWILNRLREADGAADGALIVAAVNDYGPLLDIADGLLDLHYVSPGTDHCHWCWDGPVRRPQPRGSWWPCPSVRPVLAWLDLEAAK